MRIYKISSENYTVLKKEESDRTRYFLSDSNGKTLNNDGELIGRLVIQSNIDPNYYILTGFKIDDPEQRGKGLGSLLMKEFLSDSKWTDKPVLVDPLPYSGDDNEYVSFLRSMYEHYGFESYQGNYMILRKRK